MKKRHMLLAAAATVAGLVALAGPAQAVPPQAGHTILYLEGTSIDYDGPPLVPPPPEGQTLEAAGDNGYCAFPVKIDYLSNQKGKERSSPPGSTATHFTGFASATVTNLHTGKTLTFKVSGPGTFTTFPDTDDQTSDAFTLDVAGANLLWTTVANSYPGVPQLAYTTGHVQVTVAAGGKTTSYELNGNGGAPTDVCALLGPS
jgi:hypothetical protein